MTTRAPVKDLPARSTGNGHGGVATSSNLIVESSDGRSDSALRAELLQRVKQRGLPYGIIVRELGGAAQLAGTSSYAMTLGSDGSGARESTRSIHLAYRVYPDNHEELVRGAQLSGVTAAAFKEIVAVGNVSTIYDVKAPFTPTMTSYVVPSLLFDDLTVVKMSDEQLTLPFSSPPPAARACCRRRQPRRSASRSKLALSDRARTRASGPRSRPSAQDCHRS